MEPIKGGTLANPPREALDVIQNSPVKRTPVDWALQFLWNRPEVATVLSGMSTMGQVVENCDSADNSGIGSLSESENTTVRQLAEIYQQKILIPCTGCEYCLPCPRGVNIPQNFALLNSFSLEMSWYRRFSTRLSYRKLVSRKKRLDIDQPNGRASLCINCGDCLDKCPQDIAIPIELEKMDAVLGRWEKLGKQFQAAI
jgi:predicted aldo/keto reductase-like oxidoreductase